MAYQWYPDPNSTLQPGPPQGYQGPIYYSRSTPNSPYAPPQGLMPTPPGAVSPLPTAGGMWVPAGYSPGQAPVLLPSPGRAPLQLPSRPVLLDVLNPASNTGSNWRSAASPHLYYDLRDYPTRALVSTSPNYSSLSANHLAASITNPETTTMKIISKLFPWEVDVVSDGSPITVDDLITAIHETLQKHITGSEWWIVTDDVRARVSEQYIKNCDATTLGTGRHKGEVEKPRAKSEGLRRVDWLLDAFVMKGLEKDDTFAATRFRDKSQRENVWVLVTGPK